MDDLRNAINTQAPETDQPRDENGRFVAVAATPEPAAVVDPLPNNDPETFLHREEIDNGEGGKEVFEGVGNTPEEALQDCLAKIVEAKGHATRKIRELTAKTAPPTTVNPLDEGALAQELLTSPSVAFAKLFQQQFGETPEETKARLSRLDTFERGQSEIAAANQFMQANPDYYVCIQNANRIEKWLKLNGKDATAEGIQQAYDDLKQDGLLVSKPKPTDATPAARPRSSGISTRTSLPAPTPAAADPYSIPLDKLRELAGGYVYKS